MTAVDYAMQSIRELAKVEFRKPLTEGSVRDYLLFLSNSLNSAVELDINKRLEIGLPSTPKAVHRTNKSLTGLSGKFVPSPDTWYVQKGCDSVPFTLELIRVEGVREPLSRALLLDVIPGIEDKEYPFGTQTFYADVQGWTTNFFDGRRTNYPYF